MIEVTGLTKRYGQFTAVRDLSFMVRPGEVLGLVGPNGAGKTTTLRCATGLIPPTQGTARIGGIELAAVVWWLGERFESFDLSQEMPR